MRNVALALVLFGVAGTEAARSAERTVVVPMDPKPFAVDTGDIVRLTGKGIAGSKIEIKIDGPAKVETTSKLREVAGGRALLGNVTTEYDLKPTGPGKVSATITVTPPQPDARPKVARYEFEVK